MPGGSKFVGNIFIDEGMEGDISLNILLTDDKNETSDRQSERLLCDHGRVHTSGARISSIPKPNGLQQSFAPPPTSRPQIYTLPKIPDKVLTAIAVKAV